MPREGQVLWETVSLTRKQGRHGIFQTRQWTRNKIIDGKKLSKSPICFYGRGWVSRFVRGMQRQSFPEGAACGSQGCSPSPSSISLLLLHPTSPSYLYLLPLHPTSTYCRYPSYHYLLPLPLTSTPPTSTSYLEHLPLPPTSTRPTSTLYFLPSTVTSYLYLLPLPPISIS